MTQREARESLAAEWFRAMCRPSRRSFTPMWRLFILGLAVFVVALTAGLLIAQCDGCRAAVGPTTQGLY